MLFWLPYCVVEGTMQLLRVVKLVRFTNTLEGVFKALYLMPLFNSLVDPLIYALRMREVRRGMFFSQPSNQPIHQAVNQLINQHVVIVI